VLLACLVMALTVHSLLCTCCLPCPPSPLCHHCVTVVLPSHTLTVAHHCPCLPLPLCHHCVAHYQVCLVSSTLTLNLPPHAIRCPCHHPPLPSHALTIASPLHHCCIAAVSHL